jgi:outer membrane protein OmpA-like peptidoglycan-associated protein
MSRYKLTKAGYLVIIVLILSVGTGIYFLVGSRNNVHKDTSEIADKQLENKVEDLKSDVKMQEIEKLNTTIEQQKDMIEELNNKLQNKEEKLKQMEDVIKQSSTSIYFKPNAFKLQDRAKKDVIKFIEKASVLDSDIKIVVVGNVFSPKGKETQNYGLLFSLKRAESVASYLVEMGIDEERLEIIGKGAADSYYYDDNFKSAELSRRVNLYFE